MCIVGIARLAVGRITLITAARLHQKPKGERWPTTGKRLLPNTVANVRARSATGAERPLQPALLSEVYCVM